MSGPNFGGRPLVLALLVTFLILFPACSSPTVTLPDLSEIHEKLGYRLAPTYLPEGFNFHEYETRIYGIDTDEVPLELAGTPISIFYSKLNHNIVILYPQVLPPSAGYDSLFKNLGLDWQRPEDAIEQVFRSTQLPYDAIYPVRLLNVTKAKLEE